MISGRVKSLDRYVNNWQGAKLRRGKIIKQTLTKDGYCRVCLCKENKKEYKRINRLVAEAFLPNPSNLPQVNHIDENKENNSINNLEWCDCKYNINYGNGIKKRANKLKRKVVQRDLEGNIIREWDGFSDIAKELGYNKNTIWQCCNGKSKISHNYIWNYKEVD